MKHVLVGILNVIFLICISNIHSRSLEDVRLDASDLIVETTSGLVQGGYGGRTLGLGKDLYEFRGIPFAEPPVGNLRFQPPVPVRRWEGVKDVSTRGPDCIQGSDDNIIGSEDCLFLKIHTTELPKEQKKLPVMVWIYGGAFFFGSVNFNHHFPDYLLDQDVIVVGLNYRLGIFGFLSTEDTVVPGNNGLKDQVLALKWIKENIERFGGDPDNITVFGQSAGGASIAYLLQTPQTRGLFHRAIIHSGSSLCLWSLSRTPLSIARAVAEDLGLDTRNTQVLVNGLRTVDANELQSSQTSVMLRTFVTANMREGLVFGPVIEPAHDGAILSGNSHELLENGNFHDVPIIIGYTSLEARLSEIPDLLRVLLLSYDIQLSRLVPINMRITSLLTRNSVGRQIKNHYFGSQLISASTREVMEFISDDQFVRPIQEAARLYSRKNPVYFYRFSYEGALFGVTNRTFPGVGHTEDLGYLFDFGHPGSVADNLTRSRVVKLWSNFAKTGNPTPVADPLLQGVRWEALQEDTVRYLEIDRDLEILQRPNAREITFWNQLYDRYGNPPYSTY